MQGTPVRFDYTGSEQTYTVPNDCTNLIVDCIGAAGGKGTYSNGSSSSSTTAFGNAKGGRVQCNLTVTPGQILYLYVGGKGTSANAVTTTTADAQVTYGGWNGGGQGYSSFMNYYGTYIWSSGGGGGGASDIRIGGTALSNRKVVAGGAGGCFGQTAEYKYTGGAGGGLTGGQGNSYTGASTWQHATGGTQSAGGTAGGGNGANGTNGSLGQGGRCFDGSSQSAADDGAGGGGGYYGGGGNGNGAGGGGSSYTDSILCTDVTHTQGYSEATGNGWIILTPILPDIYTRDSSKDKTASMPTTTYEAFIAAGYKTDGSVAGVYLKDLHQ
jgi:hypothetical protein